MRDRRFHVGLAAQVQRRTLKAKLQSEELATIDGCTIASAEARDWSYSVGRDGLRCRQLLSLNGKVLARLPC